jgi:DNA-directed RNA polymerase omega subunit
MAEKLENKELTETEETTENAEETKVTPEIDSKYRLILLAAQRSKQLQKGATPRVQADPRKIKSTRIALEEFRQKKVHFEFTDED